MSAEVAGAATRRRLWVLSLIVAAVVVVVDQLTKRWALNRLRDGDVIDVVWTLRLNLTFNSGFAFSQGEGFGPVIGVVAMVVLVVLLLSLRQAESRLNAAAVGLVVGGALGNLLDRIFRGDGFLNGHVIDFIDLQWWPVFNIADAGIVVGGILLVVGAWRGRADGPAHA